LGAFYLDFTSKKVLLSLDGPKLLNNDRSQYVNKKYHPTKLSMLYMMASMVFLDSIAILSTLMFT
jgi:hypothetical protein